MKTNSKKIFLLIFIAVILVVIIALVSYAYFNSDLSDKDTNNHTIYVGDNFTLSSEGSTSELYNVSDFDMFGVSYDVVAYDKNTTLNITLENDDSEKSVTCDFAYAWRWDAESEGDYVKTASEKKEFTVTLDNGSKTGEEQQVPDYTDTTSNLGTGTITIGPKTGDTNTTTITVNINTKFYNLSEVNQEGHRNKSYMGGVIIQNATCTQE